MEAVEFGIDASQTLVTEMAIMLLTIIGGRAVGVAGAGRRGRVNAGAHANVRGIILKITHVDELIGMKN